MGIDGAGEWVGNGWEEREERERVGERMKRICSYNRRRRVPTH